MRNNEREKERCAKAECALAGFKKKKKKKGNKNIYRANSGKLPTVLLVDGRDERGQRENGPRSKDKGVKGTKRTTEWILSGVLLHIIYIRTHALTEFTGGSGRTHYWKTVNISRHTRSNECGTISEGRKNCSSRKYRRYKLFYTTIIAYVCISEKIVEREKKGMMARNGTREEKEKKERISMERPHFSSLELKSNDYSQRAWIFPLSLSLHRISFIPRL